MKAFKLLDDLKFHPDRPYAQPSSEDSCTELVELVKGRHKCKRPSANKAGIYVKGSSTHIGNTYSKDIGNTFLTAMGKDGVLQEVID